MVTINHNGLTIEAVLDMKNPSQVKEAVLVYAGKYRIELGGGRLSSVKAMATRKAADVSADLDKLARWNRTVSNQ